MLVNNAHLTELNSPKQTIKARVEIYRGSALEAVCNCGDVLQEFSLERTGENKFFGFGICQKLRGTLVDINRNLSLTTNHNIEASFGVSGDFIYPFPKFYVQEVKRDEVSNAITFSAYDILYKAENYTFSELSLGSVYTVKVVAAACANILNVPMKIINVNDDSFDTEYLNGANFSGKESVRRVLDAIAEVTQTVYYIDSNWELVFRRLEQDTDPVLTITKDMYVSLQNEGVRRLNNIMHATELGDNVASVGTGEGVTQYIRNNPFWDLREDIGDLVENAHSNVEGISYYQFESEWTGNYLLEIGDKIALIAEDNSVITSYLLDDTIIFDGALMQNTKWQFENNEGERASNPTTLGDALNDTYAKVDKANRTIELVASETRGNTSAIAALQINTDSISASVSKVQEQIENKFTEIDGEFVTLTQQVEAKITEEDLTIEINKVIDNGVKKVETSTGFTFDENGLSISKSGNEVNTLISHDGMRVFRQGESDPVLVANNEGVNAENLHATTYLIIGDNSRFEDYNNGRRTGCFWIGR